MKIDTTLIMQILSYAMIVIGAMAFIVSVITQVIKSWPGLNALPTSAVVIVLSLILCPVTMLAAMQYLKQPVEWYMIFACMLAAFIVALVAMDGWERVTEIWDRTKAERNNNA